MKKFVIAITRTCGSGGTTIGKMLADHYKINMYDRELLRLASDDSGISMAMFEKADENTRKTNLFNVSRKVYSGEVIPPENNDFTSNDNLFNYQAKVMRELCLVESYVVIGRCADYVLQNYPDVIKIFMHASRDFCISHQMEKFNVTYVEAVKTIDKMNKYRSGYYKYHAGRKWEDMSNYDLCLNTGVLGFENSAELIKKYVELKSAVSGID